MLCRRANRSGERHRDTGRTGVSRERAVVRVLALTATAARTKADATFAAVPAPIPVSNVVTASGVWRGYEERTDCGQGANLVAVPGAFSIRSPGRAMTGCLARSRLRRWTSQSWDPATNRRATRR